MSDPLLRLEGLKTYFYTDEAVVRAVDGVSLEVGPGETLAVVGESGSGKSVTALSILRLVPQPPGRIVAGRVRFKGEDITGLTADQVSRRGMARTFQLIQIFPGMTALENMLMAAQERHGTLLGRLVRREEVKETDRALRLLQFLGIASAKDSLASNLSYGQQKLLDFGMALMSEPEVILLDEPMAGVNPTMVKNLVDHIQALNAEGYTFVIIEHNMEVVMSLCRRIIVLSQGERIAEGTPSEVAANPLVLDAYFGK